MKKQMLILSFLMIIQTAHSQSSDIYTIKTMPESHDTVSVDEMKYSFYSSLNEYDEKSYDTYDWFFLPYSPRNINYVIPSRDSQPLHRTGRVLLPASSWKWLRHDGKDSLYWTGFRSTPADIDTLAVRNKLKKAYGVYKYNGIECVPAKWYSGNIEIFANPSNYRNMNVSNSLYNITVSKGKIVREYYCEKTFGSLSNEVYDIKDAIFIHGTDQKRDTHYELFIFQHDINRLCQKDTSVGGEIPYSFLLSVDGNRKAHIHTLLPTVLSNNDSQRIQELTEAVEAQPAGIFGTIFTVDGRVFPGRYLMAVYTSLGWRFKDYRYRNDNVEGLFFKQWKEPL